MPGCVVTLCKNNTTKNKKDSGITYHQFPADPVICDRWTAIVRRSRQETCWKPGKRSIICSAHFNESDWYITKGGLKRLCKGAVPQNALFLSPMPSNNSATTAEPRTSVPVVNANNSAVTKDPSSSVPVVNSNNSTVTADSSTSVSVVKETSPLFDTPREIKLKKELHKKTVLQFKHSSIIKNLREKTRRLKKANCSLKSVIKSLKQRRTKERFVGND